MFQERNYPFIAVVLPTKYGMAVVGRLQGWHGMLNLKTRIPNGIWMHLYGCASRGAAINDAHDGLLLIAPIAPKLAIVRQCTSVTDRRTDRRTLTS